MISLKRISNLLFRLTVVSTSLGMIDSTQSFRDVFKAIRGQRSLEVLTKKINETVSEMVQDRDIGTTGD